MSKIEMSPVFAANFVGRMMGLGVNHTPVVNSSGVPTPSKVPLMQSSSGLNNNPSMQLCIMKGTIPYDFSTLILPSDRQGDVLITFATGNNSAGDFTNSLTNVNPAVIQTNYVAASANGAATWYWWRVLDTSAIVHQVIGTVGTIGSGEDLEIPCVDVITGVLHRVLNLKLQFPTSWVY